MLASTLLYLGGMERCEKDYSLEYSALVLALLMAAPVPAGEIHTPASLLERIEAQAAQELPARWKAQAPELAAAVVRESLSQDLDARLILAVIAHESKFNPDAVGSHGEIGLMQILPMTGKWIAKKNGIAWSGRSTLVNPKTAIRIGTAYLVMLKQKYGTRTDLVLSAYNMGATNVARLLNQGKVPHEYANKVMKQYGRFAAL